MDPQWESTAKLILLPELKIITHWQQSKFRTHYKCEKVSDFEVCPKCAMAVPRTIIITAIHRLERTNEKVNTLCLL